MITGDTIDKLLVGEWFQGPTGQGQGGWAAAKMAALVGEPIRVGFRAPIPLEVEMPVEQTESGWQCRHGDSVVLDATAWTPDTVDAEPLSIDDAVAARERFLFGPDDHPVPYCFSCGLQPDGMKVHAGPCGDGDERFATDWTAPAWAVDDDGAVDPAVLWAALDCTAAFHVACHPRLRVAVTASYAVEILRPVAPEEKLALVGWPGDGPGDWQGRKREAASAAFDGNGRTVARARSLWIALT